jgi:1-acyl-sn-glycerol-3-phosphate acyltransferase
MWVNRHIHLGRKYRITRMEENDMDEVEALCAQGHSVLLAPNHSDHSDPDVLMELCSRHGLRPTFIGAR